MAASFGEAAYFYSVNTAIRPGWWRRLLSWVWPQTWRVESPLSGTLELNLINGRLRLDSTDANYSYGRLQKVLETGLSHIWNPAWQNILVLGLGGGSVVASLRQNFGFRGLVEAVEADPVCLQLAQDVFLFTVKFPPIDVHLKRAEDFVFETNKKWDCIIVDVFINNSVPGSILEEKLVLKLIQCLRPSGVVLFNVILPQQKSRLEKVLHQHTIVYRLVRADQNFLFIITSPA